MENMYEEKIKSMFEHDSKISKVAPKEMINNYKELLTFLIEKQKSKEIPTHEDYLDSNELATNIYQKKYFLKDLDIKLIETKPEQTFARVAAFVAAAETSKEKREEFAIKFYNGLFEGLFIPGGRVIAGAGDLFRVKTLSNCFVSLIEDDSIESIFNAAKECARTYSYGGGIGVDISNLRPQGSVVHNAADASTGAVSFMELYSMTTGLIGQSGRRGALMLTLDIKHPDVFKFTNVKREDNWVTKHIADQCKWSGNFDELQVNQIRQKVRENTQVRFANISLKVNDEFMQAVDETRQFGKEKILVYDKTDFEENNLGHYSFEIPSKKIENYKLAHNFESIEELNSVLNVNLTKEDLNDVNKRDKYGDFLIEKDNRKIAIKFSGDFMLYFASEQAGEIKNLVKADKIWHRFIQSNYETAEPGLIFWSTMAKYSPSNYVGRPIASTNPCGEVPLEDGGACNLTSLNLSRVVKKGYEENAEIDYSEIDRVTRLITRFLDNVITWNTYLNPLEKQRNSAKTTRRIGLGYIGIADMLNQLGLGYDSDKGIEIMEKVAKQISDSAYDESANLASEKGTPEAWNTEDYIKGAYFKEMLSPDVQEKIKANGIRNVAILSIAPTGSISNVVLGFKKDNKHYIGVSSGIEPIFALFYTRRTETVGEHFFKVFHGTIQAYIDVKNIKDEIATVSEEEDLRGILPDYFFRTAHHVTPEMRVKIQGICQQYIDHSISSTCNLPEDIHPEIISDIYFLAWKNKLKGVTIYRDGSRYAILSVSGKESEFQRMQGQTFNIKLENDQIHSLNGSSIVEKPDGKLSTVYHSLKENIALETLSYNGTPIKEILSEIKQEKEPEKQEEEAIDENLRKCPSCEKPTLKVDNGCFACVNVECGFSKCEY